MIVVVNNTKLGHRNEKPCDDSFIEAVRAAGEEASHTSGVK